LANLFKEYEGDKEVATIHYPERYNLKTDQQRLVEADSLGEQMTAVPSKTFQKAIAGEITQILLDSKISDADLNKIMDEIEAADFLSSNAEGIHADLERGILSMETAAKARGYDVTEVEKAKKDHAERLVRIKEAQSGARGNPDESGDPNGDAKAEKENSQNPDLEDRGNKPVRGEGKAQ